jgi:hypothetical protein
MNGTELALHFSSNTEVNVSFDGTDSGKVAFANPVTEQIADPTTVSDLLPPEGADS